MKNTCRPLSREDGEQQAARGLAVAARAAGLLVVGLDRARDALVADRPHVGLVDAHPERVGRHHHRRLAGHEAPLRLGAQLAVRAPRGSARRAPRARAPGAWRACRTRCACPRRRSPAARPAPRARRRCRGGRPPCVAHGTTANERFGRSNPVATRTGSRSPSRRDDVGRHLRRRGRRRGDDRLRPQPARRVGEPEVVGPEVVAPLRDAVRLVDHEQPDLRAAQALEEAGRGEALGRDVEQPHVAARPRARPRAGSRRRRAAR